MLPIKNEELWMNESDILLNCQEWGPDWARELKRADPIYPTLDIMQTHLVLPIPGQNATLTFYDENQCYHSPFKTLTTLRRTEEALTFYDYPLTSQVFTHLHQHLNVFQSRLHPMVNALYVLFPLTTIEHTIWINPLSIHSIWEDSGRTYIKMASGPGTVVKTRKETIIKYAANAALAFACSERDLPWPTKRSRYGTPLDYLTLPDTPFGLLLSRQPILQQFPFESGIYYHQYSTRWTAHYQAEAERNRGFNAFPLDEQSV
ncbi:hypothetical protein [Candidatus Enterococcus ferrettii]|uniref:Uncharacterized protein n=1 Tax=Candidatus Enterococcus ferrettii TaxID=2815324 RepID=A0ABV0ERS8_9ENTE|nr:hypothetical protein [Enterococcus sp. 665A]MBO1343172.1 hypothetical protein [Enterococcus sp. 665A]